MQLFINNWSTNLLVALGASAGTMNVDPGQAAKLAGLGDSNYYLLTLAEPGNELTWEIVKVTDQVGGVLTITREQEGTPPNAWPVGTLVSARLTAAGMASKASASQGVKADSAVQPGDLAAVATSGSYADLAEKPTIPATAAEVGAIPLAEKGAAGGVAVLDAGLKIPLAQLPATAITDTFVVNTEAAMLALVAQTGDVAIRPDISRSFILQATPATALGNWQEIITPAVGGGAPPGNAAPQALGSASPGVSSNASREDHVHPMLSAADVGADSQGAAAAAQAVAIQRDNHTGSQAISTVIGLQAELDKVKLQSIVVACSDESTALTAGSGKVSFRMPYAFTMVGVRASLVTAQSTGSILTIDINEGGNSVLSTRLTIDNTEKTSTTAAAVAVISDATLADDAEMTIDIDQIGDGTAKGLKVALIGFQS